MDTFPIPNEVPTDQADDPLTFLMAQISILRRQLGLVPLPTNHDAGATDSRE